MPQPSDYNEAIQAPRICFRDPMLRGGTPAVDPNGLPKVKGGNFASVYQIEGGGVRYAVRCFLTYHQDQESRYGAISAELAKVNLPFMVGFEFKKVGILVRGAWYPILRMDWVDGVGLNDYIRSNLTEPQRLIELAHRFITCVEMLERNSVSHGDLQHGNILVQKDGNLRFIDYDGMYVPALAGWGTHELGHAAYQHPGRDPRKSFGPEADRFSAWVIVVSLMSLCSEPSLWYDLNGGGDRLLLSKADLDSPSRSLAFARLEASPHPIVRAAALQLSSVVAGPSGNVPAITQRLLEGFTFQVGQIPGRPYGPDDTLPSTQGRGSWVLDHLEPEVAVRFRGSFRVQRIAAVLASAMVGIAIVTAATFGAIVAAASSAIGSAVLLALLFILARDYRRRPEVRAKVQEKNRYREVRDRLDSARAAAESTNRKWSDAHKKEQVQLKSLADRLGAIGARQEAEISRVTGESQRVVQKLQVDIAALNRKRDEAVVAALGRLQADYYSRALRAYSVYSASIAGIGDALKARLAAAGLTTAADVGGVRSRQVAAGYRNYAREVTEIKIGGTWKQIDGIGRAKAQAVADWRRAAERAAERGVPKQLPQAERDAIEARTESQRRELNRRIVDEQQRLQSRVGAVRQAFSAETSAIQSEIVRTKGDFAALYALLGTEMQNHHRNVESEEWSERKAKRELSRYAGITVRAYVAAAVGLIR
jgi:hypothetical protein